MQGTHFHPIVVLFSSSSKVQSCFSCAKSSVKFSLVLVDFRNVKIQKWKMVCPPSVVSNVRVFVIQHPSHQPLASYLLPLLWPFSGRHKKEITMVARSALFLLAFLVAFVSQTNAFAPSPVISRGMWTLDDCLFSCCLQIFCAFLLCCDWLSSTLRCFY